MTAAALFEAPLRPYLILMEAFLSGRLTADEFTSIYLQFFPCDPADWPDDMFAALQRVFSSSDSLCLDPVLRVKWAIDEEELRREVATALDKLRKIMAAWKNPGE